MIKKQIFCLGAAALFLATANPAQAHFGMVIPSVNIVSPSDKNVDVTLSFSHPFEMIGMDLSMPAQFYVVSGDKRTDLAPSLATTSVMGHQGWYTSYKVRRPGVYQFVMEPAPYWEPAEDLSIIHYTKTIIAAFGADSGWDEPVGLPTEIVPLTRPFANYSGNSFTGRVMTNGKAVPHAEVEVEFYNQDGRLKAPSDYHVTQVVKADGSGVFSFSCPREGWWGFSALNEAGYTLADPSGKAKAVELGAVLWIYLDGYGEK